MTTRSILCLRGFSSKNTGFIRKRFAWCLKKDGGLKAGGSCDRVLRALEREYGNLRRAVESNRHVNRSYASTHENRRIAFSRVALDDRKLRGRDSTGQRQNNLAAVRVSREN